MVWQIVRGTVIRHQSARQMPQTLKLDISVQLVEQLLSETSSKQ